jgi:hypothetical protein
VMGTGAQSIAAASRVPPFGLAAVTNTGMPGDATTFYTQLFVLSHCFTNFVDCTLRGL